MHYICLTQGPREASEVAVCWRAHTQVDVSCFVALQYNAALTRKRGWEAGARIQRFVGGDESLRCDRVCCWLQIRSDVIEHLIENHCNTLLGASQSGARARAIMPRARTRSFARYYFAPLCASCFQQHLPLSALRNELFIAFFSLLEIKSRAGVTLPRCNLFRRTNLFWNPRDCMCTNDYCAALAPPEVVPNWSLLKIWSASLPLAVGVE